MVYNMNVRVGCNAFECFCISKSVGFLWVWVGTQSPGKKNKGIKKKSVGCKIFLSARAEWK